MADLGTVSGTGPWRWRHARPSAWTANQPDALRIESVGIEPSPSGCRVESLGDIQIPCTSSANLALWEAVVPKVITMSENGVG